LVPFQHVLEWVWFKPSITPILKKYGWITIRLVVFYFLNRQRSILGLSLIENEKKHVMEKGRKDEKSVSDIDGPFNF
jgi:hypothetical protein